MPRLAKIVIVVLALCCPRLANAADLTLAWDAPTDGVTTGYIIFVGTASQSYSRQIDVGNVTSYTVTGLSDGTTYYFTVRAYDATGAWSDPANEIEETTPTGFMALTLSASLASPQMVGATVTFFATAAGGVAPYEFQWSLYQLDRWSAMPWGAAPTTTWTLSTPGSDYQVRVAVRSAGSSSPDGELVRSMPFTVTAPPSPTAGASATFLGADETTQGNWIGAYGADGYRIVGDVTSDPAYGQVTSTAPTYLWKELTKDARALQRAGGAGRLAATWHKGMTFDINLTDGQSHRVALYFVDWDSSTRSQRVDILDAATNAVLDSQTLSEFNGGRYLVWTLRGHVRVRLTRLGGFNAVVSAIFFDGAPPPPATAKASSATFLGADESTRGNWIGAYGADGYRIVGDGTSDPAYAQVTSTAPTLLWKLLTNDARAMQRAGGAGRMAATWFKDMTFDINLTDGQSHRVALYCVDWDSSTRSQRVDILDATTNAVLDSQTLSQFNGGRYLVWTLRGHVRVRITRLGGFNAVVSAIFFDAAPPGAPGGSR